MGTPKVCPVTERSPLPDLVDAPQTIVVTGVMAAGKSTVSQLLAERFSRAVHLRGDEFRRVVVSGRVDMSPHGDPEAERQLALRHRLAAHTANIYAEAGFTVVVQDLFVGASLEPFLAQLRDPVSLVMLAPDVSTVSHQPRVPSDEAWSFFATIAWAPSLPGLPVSRNHASTVMFETFMNAA